MQEVNAYPVNYENNDHNNQNQQYAPQNQVVLNQPAHDPSKKYHPYKTPQKPDLLYPFLACGFFTMSLYTEKDCCGSWCQNSTLCCHGEQVCYKAAQEPNPTNACCVCNASKCDCCIEMKQAFQFQTQFCCTDVRLGCPGSLCYHDSDHPVVFNFMGFTCCYASPEKGYVAVNGCCNSIGQMKEIAANKSS